MIRFILSIFFLTTVLSVQAFCQQVAPKDTISNVQLQEVSIEGAQVLHRNGYDLFVPSQELRSHSSNGLDLLSQMGLPGIYVDQVQKTISNTIGTGTVMIKINNVEASLEQLQTIAPSQIKSIKMFKAPSLKYGTEVGSVIDVKTKRVDSGLAGGVNTMNALSGNYNDDGVWFKGWSGKSEFGVQYNFKLNSVDKAYVQSMETLNFSDGSLKTYSKDGTFEGKNYRGDALVLNYNYNLPSKRVFDVKAAYSSHRFPKRNLVQNVAFDTERYTMLTNTQSDENAYSLKLYYEERFNNSDALEVKGAFAYLDNSYNRGFSSPYTTEIYDVDGKKWASSTDINYNHSFSRQSTLSVGYRQKLSCARNDYMGTNDLKIKCRENSEYLFAEYLYSSPKWYLSVGMAGNRIQTNQKGSGFTSYALLPQLVLQYNAGNFWSFMYRYNRKASSPSIADLTAYSRRDDNLQVTAGNPFLSSFNMDSHLLLANWNKKQLSIQIYGLYEYARKAIGETIAEEDGVFVHRKSNELDYRHFETAINLSHSLFNRKLRFYVEPKFAFDKSGGIFNRTNTNLSLQAGANAYYRQWSLNAYYRTETEELYGDILTQNYSTSDINIGFRHQSLQLKLGLRNVFNKKGKTSATENLSETLRGQTVQGNKTFGNMVYITLSWNLFKGASQKKSQIKDVQIDMDSGIVK